MTRANRLVACSVCLLWLGMAGCKDVDPQVGLGSPSAEENMHAALRAAWIRRVQNDAGSEYAIASPGARKLEARHPRQNLRTRFASDRVMLTDCHSGAPLSMTLALLNGWEAGPHSILHEATRVSVVHAGVDSRQGRDRAMKELIGELT